MEEDGAAYKTRLKRDRLMLWALAVVAVIAAILSQPPSADRAQIVGADGTPCLEASCSSATRSGRQGSTGPGSDGSEVKADPTAFAQPKNGEDQALTARTEFAVAPPSRTAQMRTTYMTLAQRCEAGLMDAEFRCRSKASPGTFRRARWDDEESSTLQISGRVMTEDGLGVPGVTLVASRIPDPDGETRETGDGYRRYQAESDSNGDYRFADLPDGDYSIQSVRHENYPSVRISVHAGVEFANLILRKAVTYLVEGKVTTPLGEPLYKVSVLPVLLGQASVKTDRGGFYRLPVSLPADAERLSLRFQAPGLVETNQSIAVPEKVLADFRNTETIKLDAVMHPIELTTNVIGTVTTTAGKALSGLRVELDPAGEQKRYQSITGDDGSFEFPVVTAEMSYMLRVYGSPSHKDHVEQVRIDRDSYSFDVEVEPHELGRLSGQLVNLEGLPVPNLELALRNTQSVNPNSSFKTDALGNFHSTEIPAGETVIASRSMPAFSVRGLSIDPDRETHARIVLDWGQHQLTGQVVDRHGHALPASRVMLRWVYESDGIMTSATRRTASDAQGHFRFDQLGPGPHSLEVDAPGYEKVAFDHDISRDGYNVTIRLN